MYDEIHQIQIALITKCGLYTHGSLLPLLYLSINISRCIQKPIELVWCTCEPRLYDETHKIQIALITKCGLYAHGSLLSLLYLTINISRCIQTLIELELYTGQPRTYDETHQNHIASITNCGLYTHGSLLTLLYLTSINISSCIQKPIELVWCTREPRMYDETHKIQIALITTCGLYALGSLFSLLSLSSKISRNHLT